MNPEITLFKVAEALMHEGLLTKEERTVLLNAHGHLSSAIQPGNGSLYKREVENATYLLKCVLDSIASRVR